MNRVTTQPPRTRLRIGSVSFLNAKPLIYGLEEDDDLSLSLQVPSRLLSGLELGNFDVALLPVIDYQRMDGLQLLTSGAIGCNGPTLTVRLFSRRPLEQTTLVACDTDSHTSVALARILFAELFNIRPRFISLMPGASADSISEDAAQLLIGDKVVCEEPKNFPYQLDLGEAWHELTGLPFIFACWMARGGVDLGDLPARLKTAREQGVEAVDSIIQVHAGPRGWPVEIARKYLLEYLKFDVTADGLKAIEKFHRLAYEHGMLDDAPRPLRYYHST